MRETGETGTRVARSRVVTLETFIIDEFTRVGADGVERPCGVSQIGGGGTYAIIGSRIFLPASRLGMIIDYTPSTLPARMRTQLDAFGEAMWFFRERTDGHETTRAVNRYTGDDRVFEYLSPARYLLPTDLLGTPWQGAPSTIHMISDARRLAHFEREMDALRGTYGPSWDPRIVWEPEPYDNIPANLDMFRRLVPQLDVLSPNHTEALSLLSLHTTAGPLQPLIEQAAHTLLTLRPRIGIVIRAGALGACYLTPSTPLRWVPPYYPPDDLDPDAEARTKVVDPTGAGNAFMGALAAALDEGLDLGQAVLWGSVAASFVIEQDGLPVLSVVDGRELWNGDEPMRRVQEMEGRIQA